MKISPADFRTLPVNLPDQDITLVGHTPEDNDDLIKFGKQFVDFRISLMDATSVTKAFTDLEFEIWGYPTVDHPPRLIAYKKAIDGLVGLADEPVDQILAYDYLYVRQSQNANPVGPLQGALVIGTAVAPFALTAGVTLVIDIDTVGDATATVDAAAATITSGSAETYAMTNGMVLKVAIDGGDEQEVVYVTGGASITSGAVEPFVLVDGMVLTNKVAGGAEQTSTFNTADFVDIGAATALEIAAVINTDTTGQTASDVGGAVVITDDITGTSASMEITGGDSNTILLYDTTIVNGSGDFVDASVATADEIRVPMVAQLTDCTMSGTTSVTITSDLEGTDSHVKINTSTANTPLGFSTTITNGSGDVANILETTIAELKTVIEADVANSAVSTVTDFLGDHLQIQTGTSTGAASHLEVDSTSTADVLLGVDNDLHVGATAANPAAKYQFIWNNKDKGNN